MKILVLASASVLAFAAPAMAQDNGNASYIQQIGDLNTATVVQNNDSQLSSIKQLSNNDTALVEQNGESNKSVVLQQASAYVSGNNLSENRMSGEGDRNYVTQNGAHNVSYTTFDPDSRDSVSVIRQDGASNFADFTNIGSNNTSLISQVYDKNTANVFQADQNNFSVVDQNGYGNAATVTQR